MLLKVRDAGRDLRERGGQASLFVVLLWLWRGNGFCVCWEATRDVVVGTCLRFNASRLATSATCGQSEQQMPLHTNKNLLRRSLADKTNSMVPDLLVKASGRRSTIEWYRDVC